AARRGRAHLCLLREGHPPAAPDLQRHEARGRAALLCGHGPHPDARGEGRYGRDTRADAASALERMVSVAAQSGRGGHSDREGRSRCGAREAAGLHEGRALVPLSRSGTRLRIFAAGLGTETNSFSPLPTGLRGFEEYLRLPAGTHLTEPQEATGAPWAAQQYAARTGATAVPGPISFSMPAGPSARRVYHAAA